MDVLLQPLLRVGPILLTFILGLTTFLLFLWHSSKKQRYWKEIGIPCANTYPFVGSLLEAILKPMHDVELERYRKLGRIYGHYEGNRAVLSVAEPELLRRILVKDFHAFTRRRIISTGDEIMENVVANLEGEEWKRVRTIITPTFTTGKIKRMMNIFKECSNTLLQNFKKITEKGKTFEAKLLYGAFTMDVIASTAFSTKLDSHNDPNNKFVTTMRFILVRNINWRVVFFLIMPSVMKFFKIPVFNPKGLSFFSSVTNGIIEERKRTGMKANDFMQLLMDIEEELFDEKKLDSDEKDDVTENYGKDEFSEMFNPSTLTKRTLSRAQIVAQCVLFFIAGYDTTASTLSFASYLLALHPDIQEKLIEELDRVLRENKGELTYEGVQSMKYLDNIISETMRLYPPSIRLERIADEDYKLGDTGLTVPKGMLISVPVYAMHRDHKLFPDPEKFDPDRFLPEEREKRDQYAYLPFGAGPRNCVGMRFALVEIKVCLAYVLCHFRIKKCPETKVPLDWFIGQGLLQPKDIMLRMEERNDTPLKIRNEQS